MKQSCDLALQVPSLREAGEVGWVEAVHELRDPMLFPLRQHPAVVVVIVARSLLDHFSVMLDLLMLDLGIPKIFRSSWILERLDLSSCTFLPLRIDCCFSARKKLQVVPFVYCAQKSTA